VAILQLLIAKIYEYFFQGSNLHVSTKTKKFTKRYRSHKNRFNIWLEELFFKFKL